MLLRQIVFQMFSINVLASYNRWTLYFKAMSAVGIKLNVKI